MTNVEKQEKILISQMRKMEPDHFRDFMLLVVEEGVRRFKKSQLKRKVSEYAENTPERDV